MSDAAGLNKPETIQTDAAGCSAANVAAAMREIASGSKQGLWHWDFASGTMVADRYCEAVLGFECNAAAQVSQKWVERLHPDDRDRVLGALQAHLADAKNTYDLEYRLLRDDGSVIWVRAAGSAVHPDANGKPQSMIGFIEDITHRKTVEDVVTRQQELLQTIFDHMPVMIGYIEADGKFALLNKEWERTLGWTLADFSGVEVFDALYPDPEERAAVKQQITNPPQGWSEHRTRTRDGKFVDTSWANIRLSDGSLITIGQDITERKRRRERLHTLMREIDHRVKNNLTSMLAMCEQSIRMAESPAEFRLRFRSKIRAMARMHMALAKERWEGVRVEDLIKLTLDQYVSDAPDRLITTGPHVMLRSRMVTPLGLTLHELGTNAQKHGAWSVPGGHVSLSWSLTSDRMLRLRWEESGGPPVKPPTRQGQGTQLIAGFVEYELSGTYRPDYRPEGLYVELAVMMG